MGKRPEPTFAKEDKILHKKVSTLVIHKGQNYDEMPIYTY